MPREFQGWKRKKSIAQGCSEAKKIKPSPLSKAIPRLKINRAHCQRHSKTENKSSPLPRAGPWQKTKPRRPPLAISRKWIGSIALGHLKQRINRINYVRLFKRPKWTRTTALSRGKAQTKPGRSSRACLSIAANEPYKLPRTDPKLEDHSGFALTYFVNTPLPNISIRIFIRLFLSESQILNKELMRIKQVNPGSIPVVNGKEIRGQTVLPLFTKNSICCVVVTALAP